MPNFESLNSDSAGITAVKVGKQENIYNTQKKQLEKINNNLIKIQKELQILKRIKEDQSEIKFLLDERTIIEKENQELRKFLFEYGLRWVGNDKPVVMEPKPRTELDLEIVAKRIEELNIIASQDAKQFVNKDEIGRAHV